MMQEEKVFIVGHRNPDTDSICSAISYAYLKNQITGSSKYVACRAGQINEETEFVLRYFNREPPLYMPNVGQQVCDMEIDNMEVAPDTITVRSAWEYMKESEVVTLPIMTEDGSLAGLLSVSDIANYYIDAYSKTVMSEARTKFYDIAETINGTVLSGNAHGYSLSGKILVGASSPERLASYVDKDDLVILSDRLDVQRQAILSGAGCIILTLTEELSDEIRELAEEND